jgi:protein SCO1/2
MPQKAGPKQSSERVFAIIAVVMCLVLGASFCALLFALNYHGQSEPTSLDNLPDSQPAFIQPDHPRDLVDFSLTASNGQPVTRADLDGKFLVVEFLLTSCNVTCPAVSRQMVQIQQLTTSQPDVRLVSITVNPRDDTPAVLQKYGQSFGADTNRWMFLTGEKAVLYDLIGKSFLAQDLDDPLGYMPGNFSHTERIAVVDPQGHLQGYFDGLNQNTAGAVVDEIAKLRNQKL